MWLVVHESLGAIRPWLTPLGAGAAGVQSCQLMPGLGGRYLELLKSVLCTTSKPSCVSSQPSLQCSCNFLKSCLRSNYLYTCYRYLKVLAWHPWGERGEVVLCSMISSPTFPSSVNKAGMPDPFAQWKQEIPLPIPPCQRYHCKPSFSVYFATCKMPSPLSLLEEETEN